MYCPIWKSSHSEQCSNHGPVHEKIHLVSIKFVTKQAIVLAAYDHHHHQQGATRRLYNHELTPPNAIPPGPVYKAYFSRPLITHSLQGGTPAVFKMLKRKALGSS